MDSENPDEKDGSKDSGEKNYRGVQKQKYGKFMARCGSGPNRYLGMFNTADEAARAYDVRAREIYGPQADVNFPDSRTDDNSSPATESARRVATPSVADVQGVPSGSSNAITKNKRKKGKRIIISDSVAVEAGPCAKAVHNVPQFRAEDDFLPATIRSECTNIPDEQHLEKSVLAEVTTAGGTMGNPGFTTIAVTEPHAAAEEVKLATATNDTLLVAESSVIANRPESANHLEKSVMAEVSTTGGIIRSPGSTAIAVTEPRAAAEKVKLPTASNDTLPVAELLVIANRPESANILDEQHLEKSVLAEVSTTGGIIGSPELKDSAKKEYKGVQKTKYGKFKARFGSGPKRHLGTFNTAAEAARAYDVRAREFRGPQADLNFPDSHTDDNSSPATESAMPVATPSVTTHGVPSGSLNAITKIAVTKPHAAAAEEEVILPTATNNTLPVAELSVTGVANRPESANITFEQEEVNKYIEYVKKLFEEEDDDPVDEEMLKHYIEDLTNLLSNKKGSESS